ncbi:MAG: phage tail tape measure protein, partial [Planctomycetota bacterium]
MSTTGIRAGRAFVVIGIDDKVTAALSRIQKQVRGFADSVGGIGRTLAGVGAAIATPLGLATASFASFDDAMRAVQGVTGSNAAQLESLTAVAAELGRTTSFTSTEVASLMTELGRAGFNPKQIEDATSSVLALSRATGTDAAISAGIMAATLRQFSMDASEAARVSDVLAATANKTFNSVESLGEALSYAGPVAKQLGMSIEDTAAMLGMLGNVGIQGSAAGTALRRMGIIAASSGDQLREAFDVSNIDAAGNMRPLVDIIGDIGRSIQSLPVTEQVEKMEQVFGLLGIT